MEDHISKPDLNRLSVITASILLTYALSPFVDFQEQFFSIPLFGASFTFRVGFTRLISLMVAVLAAVGMEWLLRNHPSWGKHRSFQHWFLPAMTAWVIGFPLSSLTVGLQWWIIFALGGGLLVLVLLAEYIVYDFSDILSPPAIVGLTAISFALFLFFSISIRAGGMRLYLVLPSLWVTGGLVIVRALFLRLGGKWRLDWMAGIATLVSQIAIGLHYWPISPLRYGLILLGPAYALTSLAGVVEEGQGWHGSWVEPVVMLLVIWGLAFLV
jgi:hypothetical protein